MTQKAYGELSEAELQSLYIREGDRQAFFEVYQRYMSRVMANWREYQPFLFRYYTAKFQDFFDELLEEGLRKWNPELANFHTFFVGQICRRRVIDFTRGLWKDYYGQARPESIFISPDQDAEKEDVSGILDTGSQPWKDSLSYSEQDLQLFREALGHEKPDCQALLRLMRYSGPKKFEDKAEVLATIGFKKKATGWRDTWRRNRKRITAYIATKREKM